ncbi:MAG: protein kinase [Myxococcota bacterium]
MVATYLDEARLTLDVDPFIGVTLNDRYKILDPIGSGGAGHVYRAQQLQLDREVAVKVVRPDVAPTSRKELEARFFREASLAGRLSHANVVQTIDYGTTEDGRQFVVMELLRGETLKRAMHGRALDAPEATRLASALARGLHHAHERGLVHRDVKSSNVLLVPGDYGIDQPKLLDFGLVKSVERELEVTQSPTYLGTPLYMSPEQARGEMEIDARSDVYSLGCLLYRMLTGKMPFRGESAMSTALMHISDPVPLMADVDGAPQVDPALEALVRKALEKQREDRWSDAESFARALDDWRNRPPAAVVVPPAKSRGGVWAAVVGVIGITGVLAFVFAISLLGVFLLAYVYLLPVGPPVPNPGAPVPVAQPAAPTPVAQPVPQPTPPALVPSTTATDGEPPTADVEPEAPEIVPVAPPEPVPPVVVRRPPEPPPNKAPKPVSAPDFEPVEVDGYTFQSLQHIRAALRFANQADRDGLKAAGVSDYTVDAVLDNRPYRSIQSFGWTKGIGPKTVRAIAEHTQP